ncbi:hypothetical protein EDEG_00527 [Edhazardia aedis USNM 41457]|uniref:Peptidase M16 N-terminal domain-containing protein n=1 Tax=Edhazardia aedis (strain USNM 41457) TaxID=1003232 RepID=J9DIT3_EDHAE|nr:hypothetical protein EDEG_00527 [Edhazardia aedis USNM 41457]|eukprot:EJW01282.1 hypothetical protein EDEG_00527 [Edhazardia aedis USNM 41457]
MTIVKSNLDKYNYRYYKLRTGLKVVFCINNEIDKCCMCLSVLTGTLDDTKQGISHFLEHMLFMGTSKFPQENDFNEFLQSYNGYTNAYTAYDMTVYYYEVMCSAFRDSCLKFCEFFKTPLFLKDSVEREVLAVDSEHKQNIRSDLWRFCRMFEVFSEFIPFGTGSKDTLCGDFLHDDVRDFWENNYCPSKMCVSVVLKDENDVQFVLDCLDDIICLKSAGNIGSNGCNDVLNKLNVKDEINGKNIGSYDCKNNSNNKIFVSRDSFSVNSTNFNGYCDFHREDKNYSFRRIIKKEFCNRKIYIRSIDSTNLLKIHYEIPNKLNNFKLQTYSFLEYLICKRNKGSLYYYLKHKKLAYDLSADVEFNKYFSIFEISVSLCDEGIKNIDKVIKIIYKYFLDLKNNTNDIYNNDKFIKNNDNSDKNSSYINLNNKNESDKSNSYINLMNKNESDKSNSYINLKNIDINNKNEPDENSYILNIDNIDTKNEDESDYINKNINSHKHNPSKKTFYTMEYEMLAEKHKRDFKYLENKPPLDHVTNLALNMQYYPIENIINCDYLYENFDITHFKQVIDLFLMRNWLVFVISDQYFSDTTVLNHDRSFIETADSRILTHLFSQCLNQKNSVDNSFNTSINSENTVNSISDGMKKINLVHTINDNNDTHTIKKIIGDNTIPDDNYKKNTTHILKEKHYGVEFYFGEEIEDMSKIKIYEESCDIFNILDSPIIFSQTNNEIKADIEILKICEVKNNNKKDKFSCKNIQEQAKVSYSKKKSKLDNSLKDIVSQDYSTDFYQFKVLINPNYNVPKTHISLKLNKEILKDQVLGVNLFFLLLEELFIEKYYSFMVFNSADLSISICCNGVDVHFSAYNDKIKTFVGYFVDMLLYLMNALQNYKSFCDINFTEKNLECGIQGVKNNDNAVKKISKNSDTEEIDFSLCDYNNFTNKSVKYEKNDQPKHKDETIKPIKNKNEEKNLQIDFLNIKKNFELVKTSFKETLMAISNNPPYKKLSVTFENIINENSASLDYLLDNIEKLQLQNLLYIDKCYIKCLITSDKETVIIHDIINLLKSVFNNDKKYEYNISFNNMTSTTYYEFIKEYSTLGNPINIVDSDLLSNYFSEIREIEGENDFSDEMCNINAFDNNMVVCDKEINDLVAVFKDSAMSLNEFDISESKTVNFKRGNMNLVDHKNIEQDIADVLEKKYRSDINNTALINLICDKSTGKFYNDKKNTEIKPDTKICLKKSEGFKIHTFHTKSLDSINNSVGLYIQSNSENNLKNKCIMHMVIQKYADTFFDELRTKECFGYVVNLQTTSVSDKIFYYFVVQSERSCFEISERIIRFVGYIKKVLELAENMIKLRDFVFSSNYKYINTNEIQSKVTADNSEKTINKENDSVISNTDISNKKIVQKSFYKIQNSDKSNTFSNNIKSSINNDKRSSKPHSENIETDKIIKNYCKELLENKIPIKKKKKTIKNIKSRIKTTIKDAKEFIDTFNILKESVHDFYSEKLNNLLEFHTFHWNMLLKNSFDIDFVDKIIDQLKNINIYDLFIDNNIYIVNIHKKNTNI